ncbi:MAG TPA: DUF3862 domain-containing protein [Deltaproteobacteria bacterium]|nr:DUF3862 domain-containing protein [Deltaproteobacteria bacterium]HPR54422.1 DUF3862 domain-containing protein [Deltaproteobacteria bacterium]HXK46249.1 DUF3862 domain-containing protein [Deltaproteobacteria bacterium]
MLRTLVRNAGILVIALLLVFLVACGKVTKENYDRLQVGMEYSEVVEILGKPGECNAVLGAKDCRWGNDKKSIDVKLVGDKVIFFSSKGL